MTDPGLQQLRTGGFHDLEAAYPARLHPTRVVGDAVRKHAAALPEALSNRAGHARLESFDDEEEHVRQFTPAGEQVKAVGADAFRLPARGSLHGSGGFDGIAASRRRWRSALSAGAGCDNGDSANGSGAGSRDNPGDNPVGNWRQCLCDCGR